MKCRRMIEDEKGVKQVVWFGSYGKNQDNSSKLAYSFDQEISIGKQQVESNFSNGLEGLAQCLTQRLSVMKGELWHNISFGLPLLEKVKSKALIDSAVADIVMNQPEVNSIISFNSKINGKEYICDIQIRSNFGELQITI